MADRAPLSQVEIESESTGWIGMLLLSLLMSDILRIGIRITYLEMYKASN